MKGVSKGYLGYNIEKVINYWNLMEFCVCQFVAKGGERDRRYLYMHRLIACLKGMSWQNYRLAEKFPCQFRVLE